MFRDDATRDHLSWALRVVWNMGFITMMFGDVNNLLRGHCIRLIGIGPTVLPTVQAKLTRGCGSIPTLLLHFLRTTLHISIVFLHDVTMQILTAKLGSTCPKL